MNRRQFLLAGTAVAATASIPFIRNAAVANDNGIGRVQTAGANLLDVQNRWQDFLPSGKEVSLDLTPLKRDKSEWRNELSTASYNVLFKEDTERAGTSPLNHEKRPGIFACAACKLPLFTQEMKYESGTGWPSFFTHIPGHLGTKRDFKLIWPRTEYHCIRCGGHQGHVFDDGPQPTGQRWCNNGVALEFWPAEGAETA